jgi:hypothetical protein
MAAPQIKIDPRAGDVVLRLQAERAHPIRGVLSSRDVGHLEPSDTGNPSIVEWHLPAEEALYVAYGVILPASDLWFAPAYTRAFYQGGSLLRGIKNPRRFKTEKHAQGEWIGPPEAFRIVLK